MDEYIPREAALGFMNEVEPCICRNPDGVVFTAAKDNDMLEYLRSIPAADVVARDCYDRLLAENDELRKERPVVRCGECEHWWDNGTDLCSCDRDALLRRRDFFCADGERKDGNGE